MIIVPIGFLKIASITAKEPGRFALHSVLLKWDGTTTTLVATDGRFLAKVECPQAGSKIEPGEVLLPTTTLERALEIGRAERPRHPAPHRLEAWIEVPEPKAKASGGEIRVGVVASSDGMQSANIAVFYARRVDGTFPKYDDVFPKEFAGLAKDESICCDVRRLRDLLDVVAMAMPTREAPYACDLFVGAKSTPIMVRAKGEGGIVVSALLMPVARD